MQIERMYHPDMPGQMRTIMLLLRIQLPGTYAIHLSDKETGQDGIGRRPAPTRGVCSIAQLPSSYQAGVFTPDVLI